MDVVGVKPSLSGQLSLGLAEKSDKEICNSI
jgi:hypothetical protein